MEYNKEFVFTRDSSFTSPDMSNVDNKQYLINMKLLRFPNLSDILYYMEYIPPPSGDN